MKLGKQDFLYVFVQFVLFALYIADIFEWRFNPLTWLRYSGILLAILGGITCCIAVLQLNTNLSPFPTPKNGSSLINNGVFKYIRHPIYGGILVGLLGIGIYFTSLYKVIIVALLFVLFYFKSKYEENRLISAFPEYIHFRKTRGRFFPKWNHLFSKGK